MSLRNLLKLSAIALVMCTSGGCAYLDRLANVGQEPKLSAVSNPTAQRGYKPVTMPMPEPIPASYNPNSLWRNGSRAFFKDQRAHQVGDILTVKVNFTDSAAVANETQRSRDNKEDSGISNLFGLKKVPLTKTPIPGRLLTADSTASSDGKGSVNRSEQLKTNVAAVVTQLLPNGNLVIEGKQESGSISRSGSLSSPASCGRRTSRTTTRSTLPRSRRRGSLTAGAASSPTCSSRAGDNRSRM